MASKTFVDPIFIRHAIRLSVAIFVAAIVAQFSPIEKGLWIPMTTLIVMGTTIGGTLRKGFHRFLGTLFGLVVGSLLAYAITSHIAQYLVLILSLFAAYYLRAFVMVNYTIFVIPVTITVVFVHSLYANIHPLLLLEERLLSTLVGLAIGLAATLLLLPARVSDEILVGRKKISEAMADYLDAIAQLPFEGGETRALETKRALEKSLLTHRLLFPDARYEQIKRSSYRPLLRQMERSIQLLFGFHNALRTPLPPSLQEKACYLIQIAKNEMVREMRGETWDRPKARAAIQEFLDVTLPLSRGEAMLPIRLAAFELDRLETALFEMGSLPIV